MSFRTHELFRVRPFEFAILYGGERMPHIPTTRKTNTPALSRFNKLVSDISKFYEDARMAQVRFAWETGRRIVEEEQNGAIRAAYGTHLT